MESRRLVIIGSGPAGYSAAIYAARAQLNPVVIAGEKSGGQLMLTTEVENYAGYKDGVMGPQLMMDMRAQAERFGAVMVDKFATAVDFSQRPFRVWTNYLEGVLPEELSRKGSVDEVREVVARVRESEPAYNADSIVVATGAIAKTLGVPGESEYVGRGVSYCAVCDAAFFKEKEVYLVGGGDAAMEDALALVKFAKKVYLIVRRGELRASKLMQKRVLEDLKEKIEVKWHTTVAEVHGDGNVIGGLKLKNVETGEEYQVSAEGLFVAIGHKPMTQILVDEMQLDEKGYVVTRLGMGRDSIAKAQENISEEGLLISPTMTSVEGVFAAGDNVDFRYKQAITAAGMGCMAALDAGWWLERN